jgi:hypothetical protein
MGDPYPATNTHPPAWREPFERALDADPSDQRVRRDLADHLDERGDSDAAPLRWLADRDRRPFYVREDGEWMWQEARVEGAEDVAFVPGVVLHRLAGYVTPKPIHPIAPVVYAFRGYPTRRAAEDAFCRAFHAAVADGWGPVSEPDGPEGDGWFADHCECAIDAALSAGEDPAAIRELYAGGMRDGRVPVDDALAAAQRWMAANGRWPLRAGPGRWAWFADTRRGRVRPRHVVGRRVLGAIRGAGKWAAVAPTRRDAERGLADALAALTEGGA